MSAVWTEARTKGKGSAGQISECIMDRGEDLGQRDQLVRSVSVVLTDARASGRGTSW